MIIDLELRQRLGEYLEWEVDDCDAFELSKQLCPMIGHLPVPDQCGLPEHDYCAGCGQRTPGEARRKPAPTSSTL